MTAMCSIIPPDLLLEIAREGTEEERDAVMRQLAEAETIRNQRSFLSSARRTLNLKLTLAETAPGRTRTIYDARHGGFADLPGARVRGEGEPVSSDQAANDAYDNAGITYDFYKAVFDRDSIDGQGLELVSSVHFGVNHNNAYWNGVQMLYGDGDGVRFAKGAFPRILDVVAHELTHGVTDVTAGLVYSKQSGALNESFSDVFGSLVRQHHLGQTADEADWLIGKGILGTGLQGTALRSMKAPGTANVRDRQVAHMDDFVELPDDDDPTHDHGGVHINSGIPNHAFFLAAAAIGGNAWERAGRIWYVTLTDKLFDQPHAQFDDAARATVAVAGELFQVDSDEHKAVRAAWQQVGVLP